jgi:hypothetical protein
MILKHLAVFGVSFDAWGTRQFVFVVNWPATNQDYSREIIIDHHCLRMKFSVSLRGLRAYTFSVPLTELQAMDDGSPKELLSISFATEGQLVYKKLQHTYQGKGAQNAS